MKRIQCIAVSMLLAVGEYAFIAATVAADGKMTAQRLQVSKDGVRPPQ